MNLLFDFLNLIQSLRYSRQLWYRLNGIIVKMLTIPAGSRIAMITNRLYLLYNVKYPISVITENDIPHANISRSIGRKRMAISLPFLKFFGA